MSENSANPLAKHFRQPAIYTKLPSQGEFWPAGTLELPANGEIPIYPMTARDEIVLRTPDALLNGQGVVDVLQSCCPSIKDAWKMPSIDVDAVLIAVRIATYGNQLDVDATCPHCKHEQALGIDLSYMLDNVRIPSYKEKISFNDVKIKLHPQQYFSVNSANQIRYEEQRILGTLSNAELDDEVKLVEYSKHITRIVDLNLDIIVNSTQYIELDDGTIVSDPAFIKEFYLNCDSAVVHGLQDKLDTLAKEAGLAPIENTCEECKKTYSLPLEFDYANFFVRKSHN